MTTIHESLSAVMEDVREVGKKDRNAAQNFNFRGIDAVVNAVGPVLRKHKVIVFPNVIDKTRTVEVSSKGTPMEHIMLTVAYTFYGPEGDSLTCTVAGAAADVSDKGVPKAMSVAFRTALLQALCLPTDEPDPDSYSYERGEPAKPEPEWPSASDPDWLEAAQGKILAAKTPEALAEAVTFIAAGVAEGKVTKVARAALQAEWAAAKNLIEKPVEVAS